jgi:hypothetical protein
MPKAMLRFDLPEEETEFQSAIHGADYKAILWNIDQMLRSHVKHGEHEPQAKAAYQEVRDFLRGELVERGIDII